MTMTPDQVGKRYDGLADHWNSDAFPRDDGIAQHERALAFAARRGHALDVGCGSSGRIVELLLGHGFAVEAIDVSRRMIELARRRHPQIPFHHADIGQWSLPRRYDFISAWDCLWHVRLTDQGPVMRKLLEGLSPGGVFIFSMGGLDEPSEKTDAAMGPTLYYSTPGIPAALGLIAAGGCACRHLEYDQYPEPHVYVIAQKADA